MKKAPSKPEDTKSFNCFYTLAAFCVLLLSIFVIFIGYFEVIKFDSQNGPKYWIHSNNPLDEVIIVLKRLGLAEVEVEEIKDDWDVLWSEKIPFKRFELTNLKPHQKVNHIPGIEWLVEKSVLTTSTDSNYIPESFIDKKSFQEFASENPGLLYLQKHIKTKEIRLKEADQIDFEDKNYFVQEFLENPLLIDGHFFDFGVYVVITSIDPLRMYMYHADIMLRFCPEKYHPFNPENLNQYVISDSLIFPWNIPSIYKYLDQKYSAKSSLNAHLESHGIDVEEVWKQVEDCIIDVVHQNVQFLVDESEKYQSKNNFFELLRFDFILDEDIDIHLLKVKLSPTLHAEGKSSQLETLFEQIAYNLFNIVGIGSHLGGRTSLTIRNYEEELMLSSTQNIAVNATLCDSCDEQSCEMLECEICSRCMNWQNMYELQMTYREHMNQGNFKRLFPISSDDVEFLDSLSDNDRKLTKWITAKCYEDDFWC